MGQDRDMKNKTRVCRSRKIENIATIAQNVEENPDLPIHRRSLKLGISQTHYTLFCIKIWVFKLKKFS